MPGPYIGAEVSDTFRHRWRYGGTHDSSTPPQQVGVARPRAKIEIRRGRFVRRYHAGNEWGGPIFGDIAGGVPGLWYADWVPEEEWIEIGGLMDHRVEQSFQGNGIGAASITIDNTVMQEIAGVVGTFHKLMHGWFTPLRGYDPTGRPKAGVDQSPFFQKLPNAQIRLHTGYGDEQPTTFLGLIDDIETGNAPETASISARDMGGPMLVDQHFFGWAKEPKIRDPVIFMPRAQAEKRDMRGGGAAASSEWAGYPARGVVAKGSHNAWLSEAHDTSEVTEWIEIHVPAGHYRAIYINASFDHELFIGVMAKPRGTNTKLLARWVPNEGTAGAILLDESYLDVKGYVDSPDGGPSKPFGWVKFDANVVPGENGGFPYIEHRERATPGRGMRIPFGGELELGADSVIRVGIRHLSKVDRSYRAGVLRLQAEARLPTDEAKKARYVLIDDVTQIVECVLRWAGFKTWEVESAGVDLKQKFVVDKGKAFIDVVNEIKEMLGYSFFMGEPRDDADDQDLGYPIFRETRILNPNQSRTEQITEADLLTQGRYRLSNEDERYIIRARGKALSRKKGGRWLSGDKSDRAMFVYRPPWHDGMAGIIKHLTHADPKMETIADCQQAALLIALQIALGKYTGTIAIPGTPHVGLDTAISLFDRTVGINSRFYVSNRIQTFTGGEQAKYVTELGGGFADTPDVLAVAADYKHFIATTDRNDAR
jgi:hypothetical protein